MEIVIYSREDVIMLHYELQSVTLTTEKCTLNIRVSTWRNIPQTLLSLSKLLINNTFCNELNYILRITHKTFMKLSILFAAMERFSICLVYAAG